MSNRFEQQIKRIHDLIENARAKITWNDRIPDPDNPSQPRQIDITIRYPESFTIVECRIHTSPQDVNWIEELIGRRQSLKADAVIAVSASGYTSGAIKKATRYGIILRHLFTLSEEEIRSWGKRTKVDLSFFRFSNLVVTFRIDLCVVGSAITMTDSSYKSVAWRPLFQSLMERFDEGNYRDRVIKFDAKFDAHPILINGVRPYAMSISGSAVRVRKSVNLASVVVYADSADPHASGIVHVEHLALAGFEIIQTCDKALVTIDLSQVQIPENCLFNTLNLDFGRVIKMRAMNVIGLREAMDFRTAISFEFAP